MGSKNLAGFDVASLQRAVGNRATTDLIAQSRRIAPALDEAKERDADTVANQAVARLGSGRLGAASARISGGVPPELARLVAPDLGGVDQVRFDVSERAARQAKSIGARAFAEGDRVAFAADELDLSSREGVHLAAHELAHASLHAPGQSAEGSTLVHAKLSGTALAAEQMGGGRSTKGLRKTFKLQTNWDQILEGLRAYERLEQKLLAKGSPSPKALAAARSPLLKALAKIDAALRAWQKANDQRGQSAVADAWQTQANEVMAGPEHEEDARTKSARRQVVGMLLPRIGRESADVASGNWSRTLGLSEANLKQRGKKDKGQVGEVQELTYETEQGEYSGFFKGEMGYIPFSKTAGRELDTGIRMADPNFGARAVAMSRLDRLLSAGVTARVEFAVDQGRLGVVTESAKGTKAADVAWSTDGVTGPSVDDAVLQRCLNKLQVLDAIALQLDRHLGNYFIQTDKAGKVTGVTGIDLDMAFGENVHNPNEAPASAYSFAYRGLPKEIDEEFANRILAVSADDVRGALDGLLSKSEIVATVDRFQFVKDEIRQAKVLLRSAWGKESAGTTDKEGVEKFVTGKHEATPTYAEVLRSSNADDNARKLVGEMQEAFPYLLHSTLGDLPERTAAAYKSVFFGDLANFYSGRGLLYRLVAEALATKALLPSALEPAATALVKAVLGEHQLCGALEVAVQEARAPTAEVTALRQAGERLWPAISQRFARR